MWSLLYYTHAPKIHIIQLCKVINFSLSFCSLSLSLLFHYSSKSHRFMNAVFIIFSTSSLVYSPNICYFQLFSCLYFCLLFFSCSLRFLFFQFHTSRASCRNFYCGSTRFNRTINSFALFLFSSSCYSLTGREWFYLIKGMKCDMICTTILPMSMSILTKKSGSLSFWRCI